MVKNKHGMVWYSLGLIVIGFGGGYMLRESWPGFVLYHAGGLGAVGLLACASAAIAKNKGYGYWRAWLVTLLLSVFLGLIAAYLVPPGNQGMRPAACGGSVSLGVGLILIVVWSLLGRKEGVTERSDREE